ncbi:MAG: hypothetical protein WC047_03155 [Kiritimatiellales bacterium]
MKTKRFTLCVLAAVALIPTVRADYVVNDHLLLADWLGYNSISVSLPFAAYSSHLHSAASAAYQTQSGLLPYDRGGSSVWENTNDSPTVDPATAPYLSYTVEFDGTKSVDFDRYVWQGLDFYPYDSMRLDVRWDVDNFSSSLGELTGGKQISPSGTYTLTSVDLNGYAPIITDSIEFRVYFYNGAGERVYNSDTGGGYSSDDGTPQSYAYFGENVSIFVNEIAAVPEPATALILAAGGLLLGIHRYFFGRF